MLLGGDFNVHVDRPLDLVTFRRLLDGAGLTDACAHLTCGSDTVDHVLYRGSDAFTLEALEWRQPAEFVDADSGDPLSEHDPVAVALTWDRR